MTATPCRFRPPFDWADCLFDFEWRLLIVLLMTTPHMCMYISPLLQCACSQPYRPRPGNWCHLFVFYPHTSARPSMATFQSMAAVYFMQYALFALIFKSSFSWAKAPFPHSPNSHSFIRRPIAFIELRLLGQRLIPHINTHPFLGKHPRWYTKPWNIQNGAHVFIFGAHSHKKVLGLVLARLRWHLLTWPSFICLHIFIYNRHYWRFFWWLLLSFAITISSFNSSPRDIL